MRSLVSQKRQFKYGSFVYDYELVKQDRKTLSITVTPEMIIFVKCPYRADNRRIELFLKRKWFWLEKQLNFFGKYKRKEYKKDYVSGESFHYLGRQYQLIVKHVSINKVSLSRGVLLVNTAKDISNSAYTRKIILDWYEERTREVFDDRFNEMKLLFEYKSMPSLGVREMKRRWGSCLNKTKIILNPKLIYVPKECIDYVIIHELCHVKYKNHDKKFFSFLDEKYPKWEKTKDKLEIMGALV